MSLASSPPLPVAQQISKQASESLALALLEKNRLSMVDLGEPWRHETATSLQDTPNDEGAKLGGYGF